MAILMFVLRGILEMGTKYLEVGVDLLLVVISCLLKIAETRLRR